MTRKQQEEFFKKLLLVSEGRVGVKWRNDYEASEGIERDRDEETDEGLRTDEICRTQPTDS
tara:strand:- start:75 stop:257 length:183 start_codon:yes stop_codon:yes gene_type:complete